MDFGIIAGGEGNRIRQEGWSTPKPIVRLQGVTLIGRLLKIFDSFGPGSIYVAINAGMAEVKSYLEGFSKEIKARLEILPVETPSSMHTFKALTDIMNPRDKFIITTVDTVFSENSFRDYVKKFEALPSVYDGLMGVTSYVDDEKPLYVNIDKEGKIESFMDSPDKNTKYVSAGVYGLRKNSLKVLNECLSNSVERMRNFQRAMVNEGFSFGAFDLGKVVDVDHIGDIAKAESLLKPEEAAN